MAQRQNRTVSQTPGIPFNQPSIQRRTNYRACREQPDSSHNSEYVWFVYRGQADVFASHIQDGVPVGARTHLFRVPISTRWMDRVIGQNPGTAGGRRAEYPASESTPNRSRKLSPKTSSLPIWWRWSWTAGLLGYHRFYPVNYRPEITKCWRQDRPSDLTSSRSPIPKGRGWVRT